MKSKSNLISLRIGISGWSYPKWRGLFYPKGLPHKDELRYASRHFNSIEVNGTFYRLQKAKVFQSWYEQTPDDFVFSIKGSRFISHMKKLRDVRGALANFFDSGLLELRDKLGPILWQLPPQLPFNLDRMETFIDLLPKKASQALELAVESDRGEGSSLHLQKDFPLRYTFEVRHDSYRNENFIELLRQHQMSLTVADTAGKWPYLEDLCSDFVYVRLHGDKEIYSGGYGPESLEQWAERIEAWAHNRQSADHQTVSRKKNRNRIETIYVYFDNDIKVHAPSNAMDLAKRLTLIEPQWRKALANSGAEEFSLQSPE